MEKYILNGNNEMTEAEKAHNYLNKLLSELKEQMHNRDENRYEILIGIYPDNQHDTNQVKITRRIKDVSNDTTKKKPKRPGEESTKVTAEEADKRVENILEKMQGIIKRRSKSTYNILITIEPDLKNQKKSIIIKEIQRKIRRNLKERYTRTLIANVNNTKKINEVETIPKD